MRLCWPLARPQHDKMILSLWQSCHKSSQSWIRRNAAWCQKVDKKNLVAVVTRSRRSSWEAQVRTKCRCWRSSSWPWPPLDRCLDPDLPRNASFRIFRNTTRRCCRSTSKRPRGRRRPTPTAKRRLFPPSATPCPWPSLSTRRWPERCWNSNTVWHDLSNCLTCRGRIAQSVERPSKVGATLPWVKLPA